MTILDCTLRDGSYAIRFQFTAADTAAIAGALDGAGFELIEVGHGVGLHAAEAGFGDAAATDAAHIEAAAGAVKSAKIGVFCIPHIARLEDVDMAAKCGAGFVRIGTDVDDVERAAPFVERARKHGLFVCSNVMKSYTLDPRGFGELAKRIEAFGSETIYVVDSAGGMLPNELEAYVHAVENACGLPIAFHGHDNLGLAVANSVRALQLGATIVDASLQGLGRSAGNAPTELLVAVLHRMGLAGGINPLAVLDIGERFARPLLRRAGRASLDVVCGLAQFHSSYMGLIREVASARRVDPRRLILEVCKIDRANAPRELVEACAARLPQQAAGVLTSNFHFEDYVGAEQADGRRTPRT